MKFKSLLALLVVFAMLLAACGQGGGAADGGTADAGGGDAAATGGGDAAAPADGGDAATPADGGDAGGRDHYRFRMWYSYEWYSPDPWGEDAVSRHWGEMFNIYMEQGRPDAIADEVLNLMIAADDLPDVIWMDRNAQNIQMAQLGLFVPVNDMIAMVDNDWYNENIMQSTQELFQIDGVNYIIPNWARQGQVGIRGGATGGNIAWMVTTNVHDALGNPEFHTWYDLFDYAVAIRDSDLTNAAGVPIIPVLFNTHGNHGTEFINWIYRSHGGTHIDGWWTIQEDGTLGSVFTVPLYRETVLEANRWFREGLIPETNFTNTLDQFLENLTTGRGGLVSYDHSQDDGNSFRRILRESDPGNSIEVVTVPGTTFIHPPARGLNPADIYHDMHGTMGWNGSFITTSAERPERIFEFLTWILTPLGSIEMILGPQGHMWDELDGQGFPILHTPPGTLSAEELNNIGAWTWTIAGHANNVDNAKFAANEALPPEQRNWVETMQQTIFTPNMFISDEFAVLTPTIDPTAPLGISRTLMIDHFEANLPLIIMAATAEEAEQRFDAVLAFAEANNLTEIVEIKNERYQHNVALQGGSAFRPPGSW